MKAALVRYAPLLILAAAWEAVVRFGLVSDSVLPSLVDVVRAWFGLMNSGDLWLNTAVSLYRAGAGLALAVVVGAVLGVAMAWYRPVNALASPLVEMLYPMPKSALIPVTAVWLGFGDGSKILLIFLGCMLPVTLGALTAPARATRFSSGRRAAWGRAGCARSGTSWCRARCPSS